MVADRKRYWSFRELYRKYALHLKKVHRQGNVGEYERQMKSIRQYLEWMKSCSLTIYTLGKEEINRFFQYLFSYSHPITGFYCSETLVRRLREIYRFHAWLSKEHLVEENVFCEPLRREIRSHIKSRDRPTHTSNPKEEVPAAFRELFEEARLMDEQRRYHPSTLREHKLGWKLFFRWLAERGIKKIEEVNEQNLIQYQEAVRKLTNNQGHRVSPVVQLRKLVALKRLLEYWWLTNRINRDLDRLIELPKYSSGVPRTLMNYHEVEKLLSLPDLADPIGIRDRAMMEVFFSTGMRSNELCHLKIEDILFTEGMVRVMMPKGGMGKQRVIAIGEVALDWVRRYLSEVRPALVGKQDHPYLFVHRRGGALRTGSVLQIMRYYRFRGGFRKPISSHSFRVTCATEMLRRRADIRYVQAQLGHTSLQSTQIYTRVLPTDLKKVHQRTHPRERRRESRLAMTAL